MSDPDSGTRLQTSILASALQPWADVAETLHRRLLHFADHEEGWVILWVGAGAARAATWWVAAPPVEGENVVLQTASLPLEVPQFYSYRVKGKHVDFFVIRMQDRVLSFLDACLTCYPRKLGYEYKDGYVACRAFDTTYSIYKLEKGIGGCFPIRIEGKQQGVSYLIARSTLERNAAKF